MEMNMKNEEVYGSGKDSIKSWEEMATSYAARLQNPYHQHRLNVIDHLIPKSLYEAGKIVYDFGCGDGVLFYPFISKGTTVMGCDPASEMVSLAKKNLVEKGLDASGIQLGGVNVFAKLEDASCDAVLSFNVLAYLTDEEEAEFYKHASRVVKPGGWLIVTHSNNLFDLYSSNRMTIDFLKRYLLSDHEVDANIPSLFTHADAPKDLPIYNIRENPLAYPAKLKRFGFEIEQVEYINWHTAPPLLKPQATYRDTLAVPEEDRWKLMFTCSTFGARAIKVK